MSPIFSPLLFFFNYIFLSHSLQPFLPNTNCSEQCGRFQLPFPFHLSNSCSSNSTAFRLSCTNSTTLYVNIESQILQVLDILSDSILVNIPTSSSSSSSSSCRMSFDVNSFTLKGNRFYGVSDDNLIRLYDCEDSSVCKVDCEQFEFQGCGRNDSFSCCYPLSDRSVWQFGDGFSVFTEFGCRRFESWVVESGTKSAKWGIKIEWAVPKNSSEGACARNAVFMNSTAVRGGGRCVCKTGFVGDGFAEGVGCLQSCIKDGQIVYGVDCHSQTDSKRRFLILAAAIKKTGVLVSAFVIAAIVVYHALCRPSIKANRLGPNPAHLQSITAFRKACRTRLFTYRELEQATKGFDSDQNIGNGSDETVHAGVLDDGSLVAVHKIQCDNEQDFMQVLMRVEFFSMISHKNVAHLLGCCIDSSNMLFVVYEFFANGTLDEYLTRESGKCLDWWQRMSIAAELANALAYLQLELSPPVYHHDLRSSDIFLDHDYSVKIAGFRLLKPGPDDGFGSYSIFQGSHQQLMSKSDVYSFGVVLMEIITGSRHAELPPLALHKVRDGKLDEIVDPILCYRERPSWREQIDRVADVAARCLSFGGDGRLCMGEVAGELVQITKANSEGRRRGTALEETFSTSSLLQMISMSPDSLYVPPMNVEKQ
ncbi:probably inactive receptor-like protein kinase At2g46850 [Magnolia sinica]|uniref:probably inactive receptor-like protein kinase At2g46850 n=1 Tax=Magnolia sinica TaxID=86752 RepID=UPI00265AFA90|nr:probably inactive receptor-like protein kinase At2g46850 [Magnolia sinica]